MPSPTTPPSITPTPTPAIQRSDRNTFSVRVDAAVTWLSAAVAEFSAVATNAYNNAVSAFDSAVAALADKNTAATQAGIATAQAAAAAASATTAVNAPGTSATSTTSLELSLGAKTLTIQTGKLLVVGMPVNIAYTTDPEIYMNGIVTAADSGTGALSASITKVEGATATYANWTISLVGATGLSNLPIYSKIALTLIANFAHRLDTSDSAFTATLPAAPVLGDTIQMIDPLGTWGTNNVTVYRNGKSIVNFAGTVLAENLILNKNKADVILMYDGTNWRVI